MGKPKFSRKKYDTPSHPWQEQRIRSENELVRKYGLKNKREIWKAETALRKYRGQARELLAKIDSDDPQTKKEINQLLTHLTRFNILPLNSTLDDVLALETEAILARRLQTLTYLKGLANTPKQARQLIVQGHIAIGDNRITIPSYNITKIAENDIGYSLDSPLNDMSHPARPSADFKSKLSKTLLGDEPKNEPVQKERTAVPPSKPEPSKDGEKKKPVTPVTGDKKPVTEEKQITRENTEQKDIPPSDDKKSIKEEKKLTKEQKGQKNILPDADKEPVKEQKEEAPSEPKESIEKNETEDT